MNQEQAIYSDRKQENSYLQEAANDPGGPPLQYAD